MHGLGDRVDETLVGVGAEVNDLGGAREDDWGGALGLLGMDAVPFEAIRNSRKPVVSAVNGICQGGGLLMAMLSDVAVASEEATFGLPEVTRGLVAGAGGLLRLPRRIPYHLAMEIALTGDRFPASRLHAAGLISRLVVPGEALADAHALAVQIGPIDRDAEAVVHGLLSGEFRRPGQAAGSAASRGIQITS